jgi:biotin transport system substrate-specific component
MGYLLGFIVAATLAGMFNYNKNLFINFMKLTFSVTFIYLLGIIWLGVLLGWDKPLFQIGAQPFLLAELFKVLLVTLLIPYIKKLKKLI